MEIIIEDITSYIKDVHNVPAALAAVRDVCKARPSGYQFSTKYKKGVWDGYISLMNGMARFPTGLLHVVATRLTNDGFKLAYRVNSSYVDCDVNTIQSDILKGVTLRDYQLSALKTLVDRKRGIAKMATNAGKTEIMCGIIKALGFPKTIVLVNSKELLYQTSSRFETRLGCKVGKIGDGLWEPDTITVAMLQTLHSRLKEPWLGNKLLMIDECHHTSSERTFDIVNKISGSYRYGFSGTPLKMDVLSDMKLVAATGRILVEVTNTDLIEQGYSAKPIVHIATVTDEGDLYDENYQTAYKELIVNNEHRNIMITDIARKAKGVVLVLVSHVKHGKVLMDYMPNAVFVSGVDEARYRQGVMEIMRKAKKGIFIASPIYDEGVDIPAIDSIVLACAGKSHVKLLQRIGRGMRKKDGDNILSIYDFIDDTNKYLLEHSQQRIDTYVSEGFETILDE